MLNILICDDEKPFLDRLANKITVYLENREIPFQMAAFCSGEELLKHNEDRLFDIAFLDISMNAVSGMDAAEYLCAGGLQSRSVSLSGEGFPGD